MTFTHFDWLMQGRRNSSALAMELRLSCINPSIWGLEKRPTISLDCLLCLHTSLILQTSFFKCIFLEKKCSAFRSKFRWLFFPSGLYFSIGLNNSLVLILDPNPWWHCSLMAYIIYPSLGLNQLLIDGIYNIPVNRAQSILLIDGIYNIPVTRAQSIAHWWHI